MAKCPYCGRKMKKIKRSMGKSLRCVDWGPHKRPVSKQENVKAQ